MFHGKTKTEKMRNDLSGISMFSQTVRQNKATSKVKFFGFSAPSGNLH
jgi:hypothetical protein